ncbi:MULTISPECIES: ParA family protein [unclassified Microbacterium]|uniref:ParA family protein n=1 Tax=unclassified Microbacterium TaxID=2609290 RepID=UPI00214B1DF2|nr:MULTISPECIES: ParA family protein [unclassified Microbacterium]MCR2811304.1 ParA family protein [Microbacterium sp. zg.B185]WIM19461.1 ParA family protein [Microbacterium sp. zg-B185]
MSIATHPRVYATVTGPTATFVAPDGRHEPVIPDGNEDIRQAVVRRATDEARRTGSPLELVTTGDRGDHHLLIGTDGTLAPITTDPPTPEPEPAQARVVTEGSQRLRGEVREKAQQPHTTPGTSGTAAEPPPRPSFIGTTTTAPDPGRWAAVLRRLGIRVQPSAAARRRADCTALVSRHWAGCRTIAVANGKGGVGKTMTTAMLAAVYARNGGGNVLAWDNNDTRGTLGWRTEQGLYDTTIRDLLPAAPDLLAPTAGVSDITAFVHHQSSDRYDVLRSNPELLATDQRIATAQFDLLMQVAARYYRLVIFDSGNDESAERWLRMIDSSAQLVIPTLAAPESAESAALLLDALHARDERSAALADGAVVVITQSEPSARGTVQRIVDGFAGRVRAVEVIPFDPALKAGPLRFDTLRPATRDAWLKAAASTAGAL